MLFHTFFDVDLLVHNRAEWMDKQWEALLPFRRNLIFRKRRSEPNCKKGLGLILISFTFDLCVAYEATKANRNPLTVYIAALNQQLCKMKQEGKHSRRTLLQRLTPYQLFEWLQSVNFKPSSVMLSGWLRPCICVRMCSQVHDDGRVCVCVCVSARGMLWSLLNYGSELERGGVLRLCVCARLHFWVCVSVLVPVCMDEYA